MGVARAYLDSSYLLTIINEENEAREVRRMLYKLRSNAFDVFVPHIVLGEICGVIFRDFESKFDRYEKMAKLVKVITDNKILWKNIKPAEEGAFDIMVALSGRDTLLDATDVIILSHILSDPYSKYFFTNDSKMLYNQVIMDMDKFLNDDDKRHITLKILETFYSESP